MMSTRWLAAAFAALLFLTGCSGDSEDSTASEDSAPTASETAATEDATTDSGEGTTDAAPDGQQRVTAEKAGVRFLVPEDWQILGPDALENPDSQAALESFAEGAGIPAQQLQQMATQVDVLAIAPDGAENVNVLPVATLDAIPSAAMIRSNYERLGATVSGVEEMETPIGEGRVAFYTLPAVQGIEQSGASIFVETDAGVVNLTSTTRSSSRAPELLDEVVTTLEPAG